MPDSPTNFSHYALFPLDLTNLTPSLTTGGGTCRMEAETSSVARTIFILQRDSAGTGTLNSVVSVKQAAQLRSALPNIAQRQISQWTLNLNNVKSFKRASYLLQSAHSLGCIRGMTTGHSGKTDSVV